MTEYLLGVLPQPKSGTTALDFCAGSGSIAKALLLREPTLKVTLTDADAVASKASEANVPEAAGSVLADRWRGIEADKRFDWIVSNPPVHFGKAQDFSVVEALAAGAASHLAPGGSIWVVCQNYVPMGMLLAGATGELEASLHQSNGRFSVWRAELAAEKSSPSRSELADRGTKRKAEEPAELSTKPKKSKKDKKDKKDKKKKKKKKKENGMKTPA